VEKGVEVVWYPAGSERQKELLPLGASSIHHLRGGESSMAAGTLNRKDTMCLQRPNAAGNEPQTRPPHMCPSAT
jgi:hypothetical protein